MFGLFKKKKEQGQTASKDKAFSAIAAGIHHIKVQLAKRLQQQYERLSQTGRMVLFIAFCLFSVGCYGFLIARSIYSKTGPAISVSPITVPRYVDTITAGMSLPLTITEWQQRIQQYYSYIDSLTASLSAMDSNKVERQDTISTTIQ